MRFCILLCAVAMITGCQKASDTAVEKRTKENIMTETRQEVKKSLPRVELQTTMGKILIELDEQNAPVTAANFLRYVKEGFYNGTIFHRVISNFMIQGGGLSANMAEKAAYAPIKNEASNGLKNNRGTLAMARTNDPNSATSQFFINLVDNNHLNFSAGRNAGYAVFSKVIEGMDVVDKIAAVKTTTRGVHRDVPIEPVVILSAKIISQP